MFFFDFLQGSINSYVFFGNNKMKQLFLDINLFNFFSIEPPYLNSDKKALSITETVLVYTLLDNFISIIILLDRLIFNKLIC